MLVSPRSGVFQEYARTIGGSDVEAERRESADQFHLQKPCLKVNMFRHDGMADGRAEVEAAVLGSGPGSCSCFRSDIAFRTVCQRGSVCNETRSRSVSVSFRSVDVASVDQRTKLAIRATQHVDSGIGALPCLTH